MHRNGLKKFMQVAKSIQLHLIDDSDENICKVVKRTEKQRTSKFKLPLSHNSFVPDLY